MLYLSLEDTEWPWVALVWMQTVVLMPDEIAPRQEIYVEIAPPSLISTVYTFMIHKIIATFLISVSKYYEPNCVMSIIHR